MQNEINLLDADMATIPLTKKKRKEAKITDCTYCNGTGIDIFNKEYSCPVCGGSLYMLLEE